VRVFIFVVFMMYSYSHSHCNYTKTEVEESRFQTDMMQKREKIADHPSRLERRSEPRHEVGKEQKARLQRSRGKKDNGCRQDSKMQATVFLRQQPTPISSRPSMYVHRLFSKTSSNSLIASCLFTYTSLTLLTSSLHFSRGRATTARRHAVRRLHQKD
jgi:hypothetical protein